MSASTFVPERAPWAGVVRTGQTLRIVDLGGNQAVDCLLYDAADPAHRYSAPDTITAQRNIFLVAGTVLRSNEGAPMMTIAATTCAHHDTIGGACSRESNTLRYGHHTAHQHACVDNFLDAGLRHGLSKRDLGRRHAGGPSQICIWTGVGSNPLQGLLICGQLEMTTSTSISARTSTCFPGAEMPSTIPSVPSALTGTFMNQLMLDTRSRLLNP